MNPNSRVVVTGGHDFLGGHDMRSLDTSRAEKLLGWRASTPLDEGLRRTIEWYRSRRDAGAAPASSRA